MVYAFNRKRLSQSLMNLVGAALSCIILAFGSGGYHAQAPAGAETYGLANPAPTPDPTPSTADQNSNKNKDADKDKSDDPDAPKKEKRGSIIFAPIPILSPTFGGGIALGLGYVFKLKETDKTSPPSTIGAVAAFTKSGTRGGGIGGRLYFGENKYQTAFAVGKGRAVYDFYGIGRRPGRPAVSVETHQTGAFIFGEFMRNMWKDIFVGPRYQYRRLTFYVGGGPTPGGFEIPEIDLVSTTAALGFHVQRDKRDSTFYPTRGSLWNVKTDFFAKFLGSNRTYQRFDADYNGFRTMRKGQVLAYRGSVCSASDRTPFFDLCLYGARSDLRGYTAGQFQNHRMFATQAEYRVELPWRLGLVGFGGVGGVERYWGDFRVKDLLPAGGVGLRFNLDKKNHINYRVDWGYGRAGGSLSISVTEAF